MANPWKTSDDIVESVKRKIAFPVDQVTFTSDDILAFANEEMMISQVPSVMVYHQEYFVYSKAVSLVSNVSRYSIPDRAIGMKLRDLFWQDANGNFFEMTRVSEHDKAYFQRNVGANQAIHKYYLEGNDVVLTPSVVDSPTGSLVFFFFIRPNQLVSNDRAAIIECFNKTVTVTNASLVAGDKITITLADGTAYNFTAVSGSASAFQFQIGASSVITASNLVVALNSSGIIEDSDNNTPATNVVNICYDDLNITFTSSNSAGLAVQTTQGIEFTSIPSNITDNSVVDFLQMKPGHKILNYDVTIGRTGITGNIINFDADDIPHITDPQTNVSTPNISVGDYICTQNECIIPYLPPELHSNLAERTSARILAALGDQVGSQSSMAKIQESDTNQGRLLDNRVEGTPQKIIARHSLLRFGKMGVRRRS